MATKLSILYDSLHFYVTSLVKNLQEIDGNILQVMTTCNKDVDDFQTKEQEVCLEMVTILQNFIGMRFTCEQVSEKLVKILHKLTPKRQTKDTHVNFFYLCENQKSDSETESIKTLVAEETRDEAFEDASTNLFRLSKRKSKLDQSDTTNKSTKTLIAEKDTNQTVNNVPFCSKHLPKQNEPYLETQSENSTGAKKRSPGKNNVSNFTKRLQDSKRYCGKNNVDNSSKRSPKHFGSDVPKRSSESSTYQSHYDRRKEAQELLINKNLKKTLSWVTLPPQQPQSCQNKKNKKVVCFDIADDTLRLGEICSVCHIDSLNEFYVRTDRELFNTFDHYFDKDMNQHTYVVNRFKTKEEARDCLGRFCCGFLESRHKWYRMEVLDWMDQEPDLIFVKFVDHGDLFFWSFTKLKPLSEMYAQFPKLAIQCHLSGISDRWSAEDVVFFKEVTAGAQFKTIFVNKERDSYAVDLVDVDNEKGYTLGQTLIRNNPVLGVVLSDIEEEFEESASCSDSTGVVTASEDVKILITGYITTCHFYAHVLDINESEHFNAEFRRLVCIMEDNERMASYEDMDEDPKPGEVVLLKCGSHCYRVRCVECCGTDVEVFLLDFGYKLKRKVTDLKKIQDDLLNVPFQAVECALYNCQEINESKQTSRYFFDNILFMKTFQGRVVKRSDVLILQLWDSDKLDLSDVLRKCGLGEERHSDSE